MANLADETLTDIVSCLLPDQELRAVSSEKVAMPVLNFSDVFPETTIVVRIAAFSSLLLRLDLIRLRGNRYH